MEEITGSLSRWDRYHIITQLAINRYYRGIYSKKLGDYVVAIPPIGGTRNSYWINSMTCVAPLMSSTSCPLERLSKRRRCDTSHAMVGLAEQGVESTRVKEKTTIKTPQQMLQCLLCLLCANIINLVCLLRGRGSMMHIIMVFLRDHDVYH